MTKTGVQIRGVVIGDDFRVQRTYTSLPTGLSITKAWMTVKESDRQSDAAALLQKEITASVTADGQITDADTTGGSIGLYFDLARAETGAARHSSPYVYDVQIQVSDGAIHTLEKGTIVFILGVTDAIM
jgi:hypothetical protein